MKTPPQCITSICDVMVIFIILHILIITFFNVFEYLWTVWENIMEEITTGNQTNVGAKPNFE
jgi:hypothetical protein